MTPKKLFSLVMIALVFFVPAAMSQTKRKPKRKATTTTKMRKLQQQAQAAQDLADVLSGKSNKPLLTAEQMLPTKGGVLIEPNGQYTNFVSGYSVKFPDRNKIKKGTNSFFDDYSVFVDVDNGSQMWFVGKPDEFLCSSAEDCAESSIKNLQSIEGLEILERKNLTIEGLPAVRVKYKYPAYGNEIKIVDEVHLFKQMSSTNISYKFALLSSDKFYENDKTVFENVLTSLKFVSPKNLR